MREYRECMVGGKIDEAVIISVEYKNNLHLYLAQLKQMMHAHKKAQFLCN